MAHLALFDSDVLDDRGNISVSICAISLETERKDVNSQQGCAKTSAANDAVMPDPLVCAGG